MLDNLENSFVRRLCCLSLAVVTSKVWAPHEEWDAKPTSDEVLEMASSFDNWVRNGRK
jgi:hypothetical protein